MRARHMTAAANACRVAIVGVCLWCSRYHVQNNSLYLPLDLMREYKVSVNDILKGPQTETAAQVGGWGGGRFGRGGRTVSCGSGCSWRHSWKACPVSPAAPSSITNRRLPMQCTRWPLMPMCTWSTPATSSPSTRLPSPPTPPWPSSQLPGPPCTWRHYRRTGSISWTRRPYNPSPISGISYDCCGQNSWGRPCLERRQRRQTDAPDMGGVQEPHCWVDRSERPVHFRRFAYTGGSWFGMVLRVSVLGGS